MAGFTVVLDVGKTHSKASLWSSEGERQASRHYANQRLAGPGYLALDAAGIEAFLADALAEFARLAPVDCIVPVAHGAAAALIRDGQLALPPMDYEQSLPDADLATYRSGRDSFTETGSPALPQGLNLGSQLHGLELLHPAALQASTMVTWPQYWAWRLCGTAATEVTSLGCHTDLWRPRAGAPSRMAQQRGWAARFAPLHHAAQRLGELSAEWSARTGLAASVRVHCGLHDSNAALLAARGQLQAVGREVTVLSTGTWFVAMRSALGNIDAEVLDEQRDCLLNMDVDAKPVPSARFMGGREIEILLGGARPIDDPTDQSQLLAALPEVLQHGARILPTFVPGCGPYPAAQGCWINRPQDPLALRSAIALYVALVADRALDLIGARDDVLVEGRFAACEVFVRALATLRPGRALHASTGGGDIARGALQLIHPALPAAARPRRVAPLDFNLDTVCKAWRAAAEKQGSP
jgi:sugar (pentulose or hexulose) kinase